MATNLAMKWWIARIGWSWHPDQLVLRITFRAGEILVRPALVHGVFVRGKNTEEIM